MSKPTEGGRYIRRKDNTLERVAFTQPLGETPAAPPQVPAQAAEPKGHADAAHQRKKKDR
jgi:hypothetical protein